jgi:hypothetical protein
LSPCYYILSRKSYIYHIRFCRKKNLLVLLSLQRIMPLSSVLVPPTRLRNTASKRTPLTDNQRKERAASNSLRQAQINEAVDAWKQSTLNTAADLANRFDKKERYFLDLFFQAGTHLVHQHKKVNAYNAYLHMKAEEMRDRKPEFSTI